MSGREAINYAARARASLSLALTCFEHFYGLLRPGEDIAFQHTSILVRPRQTPRTSRDMWWSRRVLPPGPLRLLHDTIYHHSRANPAKPIWGSAPHLSTFSVRPGPDERPWAWRPAVRSPSPAPSAPACAPSSCHAARPDPHPSCGTGRTCRQTAFPLPSHDA